MPLRSQSETFHSYDDFGCKGSGCCKDLGDAAKPYFVLFSNRQSEKAMTANTPLTSLSRRMKTQDPHLQSSPDATVTFWARSQG